MSAFRTGGHSLLFSVGAVASAGWGREGMNHAVIDPKVRQYPVVRTHSAAQPSERHLLLAQLRHPPRAADLLHRTVRPAAAGPPTAPPWTSLPRLDQPVRVPRGPALPRRITTPTEPGDRPAADPPDSPPAAPPGRAPDSVLAADHRHCEPAHLALPTPRTDQPYPSCSSSVPGHPDAPRF